MREGRTRDGYSSPDPKPSSESLSGAQRSSFRQLFLAIGAGLLGVAGFFVLRSPMPPIEIIGFVAGAGALLLVIGLVWPAPKPLTAQERGNREVQDDEAVLKSGAGNHARGWENRGGTLNLTSRRLVFFSHGINARNADVVIDLAEVVQVEGARTLGIIPNAFRVITRDGVKHQFTVFGRAGWIEAVRAACPGLQ